MLNDPRAIDLYPVLPKSTTPKTIPPTKEVLKERIVDLETHEERPIEISEDPEEKSLPTIQLDFDFDLESNAPPEQI